MNDIRINKRGEQVLDGRVQKANKLDTGRKLGSADAEHQEMLRFFEPSFEETLREVVREVALMRTNKTLRPFVEGEPIGAYKPTPHVKISEKTILEFECKRHEQAREEMLALRTQNDNLLRRLL